MNVVLHLVIIFQEHLRNVGILKPTNSEIREQFYDDVRCLVLHYSPEIIA